MIFSSNMFLFLFLPICLLIYYMISFVTKDFRLRNLGLLLISLFFYFWGNGKIVFLLIFSIILNYFLGNYIYKAPEVKKRKILLLIGVIINLALLGYFKYFNFFIDGVNYVTSFWGMSAFRNHINVLLPVGISFYTFMSISYLVQTYKKEQLANNIIDYGMYLSLFPHLVAGPIVRYSEIGKEIENRRVDITILFEGLWRFSLGLGKKVILANNLGFAADKIFGTPHDQLTPLICWIGVLCYTFQIYYDFSGYTDMAIGLARFFGFHFPENFNQPYRSANITEFWRRWHMTLSRWFKDFVYIPLGGNRKGNIRTYVNLFIVFFLCGLWHGAAWTFVVWGLYHGMLLVIERILKNKWNFAMKGILGTIISFVLVMIGWVFFREASLAKAVVYIGKMFGISLMNSGVTSSMYSLNYYLSTSTIVFLIVAAIFAFGAFEKIKMFNKDCALSTILKGATCVLILFLSMSGLAESSFNPFIYFRF